MATGIHVHFNHYLHLVKGYLPAVIGMLVFDRDGEFAWQDDGHAVDSERVLAPFNNFRNSDIDGVCRQVSDDLNLEMFNLKDEQGSVVLTLCICIDPAEKSTLPVVANEHTELLNELLLVEYAQSLALASKEDELNHMTDELTKRYEELNLIYKAEDQAMNIYHGRELLRQLVINTSRFLNVDIIFLYIASKNLAMHKYRDDNPLFESERLFDYLRDTVYPRLENEQESIVINHNADTTQYNFAEESPYKHVVSPVVNVDGEVIGMLAIASHNFSVDFSNSDRNLLDVMAKKASKIAQSHFDPLTGLENNNSFELIIKDLLKQSTAADVTHAVANVDIDRMAVINDISGREAGDQLIKKVGQTLAGMVRSRDVVARIGSDKFGVLLENCDLATARQVMQKMADAISKIDMQWEGKTHQVSVSIGIAPMSAQSQSVTGILNAAETARNVSQERGRNTIHVLDLDDRDLVRRKEQIRWVGRIQSALRNDSLTLYAQLIQPLGSGEQRAHYEILLRMLDDDGKVIPPIKFLPAAESFFLMSSIDYWVINQTFSELAEHRGDDGRLLFPVSINLSGQSFGDPAGLAEFIRQKLDEYRIDARDICFEITESAAIANIDEARLFIDQVHEFGCSFSLDDFGTGLSSFAYLKNLKVNYLKIDGSFVTDVVKDPVSASMVSAINQVGHAMKLKTVAEFVENDAIRQKLVAIGVDFGQGYGLGRPQPLQDVLAEIDGSASKSA